MRFLQQKFKAAIRLARARKRQVCLELFAGKGHVAAAWRRSGFATIAFEIDLNAGYDLLVPEVLRLIKGWISSHCVSCVWLGTPCTSWSRARRGPPGSNWCRIRSDAYLDGMPGLSDRDLERVRIGNATARVSQQIIACCVANTVPCALENPRTSMLWDSRYLRHLRHRTCCQELLLDLCQYGVRWRKATRVCAWHCLASPALTLRCHAHDGLCSRTSLPHIRLSGADKVSGVLWTRRAQEYPRPFASAAARLLMDSAESHSLQNLYRLAI